MTGILALDPATVTGWAFCRPGERPVWGSQRMGEMNTGVGAAVSALRHFLRDKIGSLDPELIGYERPYVPLAKAADDDDVTALFGEMVGQPRIRLARAGWAKDRGKGPPPMNAKTVMLLSGFAATIEAEAFDHQLRCESHTSSAITSFWTGSARWGGRDNKKAATIQACKWHGFDVGRDDNAADALALLLYIESLSYPRAAAKRTAGPLFAKKGA